MYDQTQNSFNTLSDFNTVDEALRRVALVEAQVRRLGESLQGFYIQGRLRTDRVVPVNSADVQPQDLLYDRVLSASLEYILINDSGTLAWRTVTLSSF